MINIRYYYLQQMGIDPWVLRPVMCSMSPHSATDYYLTIIGEAPKTPSSRKLFKNMLKSIGLKENDVCWYLPTEINTPASPVIWVMGINAWQDLFNTTGTLQALRGQVHDYNGSAVVVSHALADLLQSPHYKKASYDDLLLLNGLLMRYGQCPD